ncbi:transmembrane protein 131 homolog [Eurosta solidaginis]|uniref:transmembrane protein 131 homolog n=1 Tax=Eurosta solidaginis TaxID=178769 RepID=UPI00353175F2
MKYISCSVLKMSGSSSTLLLVLMLLLSRAAGDINRSRSYSEQHTPSSSSLKTSAAMADAGTSDELQRSLRFEPPTLDFGEACPVGTARAHTVTLVNQNSNRSVYLTSVSGRTPTFYSSFFEAKVVPPQGNTTFHVVFLPRAHGSVATNLLIHTSFGQARLQVRGEGRDCPYRLKPLVGIKAPLNATIAPEIQMYNPHNRPLQILEVYSSGGHFQLELPSGGQEGPQTLWEIPPYETKPVIRIRFHARSAGNYTAYIRIKISEQVSEGAADALGNNGNVLVIPVEFEILPQPGLYADNPVINFGRLMAEATERVNNLKTLQIKLQLHSSYIRQHYRLLDYKLKNMPGLTFDPKDGVVILESTLFESTTILDEVMLLRSIPITPLPENITTQHPKPIECTVLIRAEVFKGALHYDGNTTTFVTQATFGTRGGNKRTLVIRNDFDEPIALLNVSLPQYDVENRALRAQISSDYLDAIATGGSLVLSRGSSLTLLQLQMLNSSMVYKTNLLIRTNITHIEVPLVVCGGRLHVSTYDTARIQAIAAYNVDLNLGAIPLAETSHNGYIVLHNRNPLPVKLNTWHFQSPQGVYFHTTFRGCLRPSSLRALHNATLKFESAKFKLCTQLEEGDVAVFQITIQSYITEQHQCTLKIWTTYEEITTTVRFRTWIGKLEVDQEHLYFNNCFPGKHCTAELTIRSTFQHPIHISSINFTEEGLHFEDYVANGSTIVGNALTKVGRIHFEPSLLCQQRCYIPQDERTNMIAFPAPENTRGGVNNNLHFDETELRRRTELFRHLKYDIQNIAFTLNSNELRQFLLELIIDIEWPKFVAGKQLLPTIEVGKMQEVQVLLSNPADTPVLIDYFLSDPKYAKETQLSLPLEVVDISPHCYLTDKEVFSLPAGIPRHPILLPAHTSLPVRIRFEAPLVDTYCTLLHIRNNLTLYEAVWVSAKVVQSQFRIGNRKPGSNTTLPFEFNEKHFAVCNYQPQTPAQHETNIDGIEVADLRKYPKVALRRTFTARNTGEMPILIKTFQIGDQFCNGYGFSITNCSSFVLNVNETRKLEFVFTPDYTLSRIAIPLRVHTNLSYAVYYNLVVQLPPGTIERCAALVPRPTWEERIRNSAIVLLATTFVFVFLAAHIDYRNILRCQTVLYEARDKGSVYPTFNLRNIALKAQTSAHTPDDEQQQTSAYAQTQRRQPQQAKNSTSSSSSSSSSVCGNHFNGATGSNNAAGVKKRGVKRQTNANSNVTTSRVSLPWSLDLNAFKGGVSLAKTSADNDRGGNGGGSNCAQQMGASESGGKKGIKTLTSMRAQQTHNEKLEKGVVDTVGIATTSIGGSNSNSGGGQSKKIPAQPQGGTSPQQHQQPRSTRRTKNAPASAAPVTEKEVANANAGNLKSQVNGAGYIKSARSQKASNSEPVVNHIGNTKGNAFSDAIAAAGGAPPTTPSPSAKEVIAQTITTGAKHGKTPGRERRKDKDAQSSSSNNGNDAPTSNCSSSNSAGGSSSASRRAERRSRQRAAAALRTLNFGDASANASAGTRAKNTNGNDNNNSSGGGSASGINGLLSCLTTAWDTGSPATFSDVLQAQPVNLIGGKGVQKLKEHANGGSDQNRSVFFFGADKEKGAADYENDYKQTEQKKQERHTFGQKSVDMTKEKITNMSATTTELGPIGSKKSPSSTPVWEPVNSSCSSSGSSNHSACGLQMPKAVIPTGNCSFFSNLLGNYEYDGNRPLRAMDSNLYDMKKAQDEYFEYMYNLRQQQLQAQVQAHAQAHVQAQQQQQQQHLLQGVDWARLNSRTWSPLATYLGQHDPLAAAVNSASASAALQMSNMNSGSQDIAASAWPIGGGSSNSSSSTGAVGANNVTVNSTVIRPPPGLESNFQGIANNTQATAQQQQQQQSLSDATHANNAASNMQTFDPFSSLSSIWSDSWQKRNNSNNSNKSKGNMN